MPKGKRWSKAQRAKHAATVAARSVKKSLPIRPALLRLKHIVLKKGQYTIFPGKDNVILFYVD